MARFSTDPGRLNRRLILEAPGMVEDGGGGLEPGFTEVGRVFAALEPIGPSERDNGGFAVTSRQFRVILRYRAGLTLAHRLRLGTRLFAIESLADPDETGRLLIATCREDAP